MKRDEGSALIWALLFVIITSGMIISHATYMAANRREMDVRYRQSTLAGTFARSGLTDALAWYQRQATQPVTSFAPKNDPGGDPPLSDTLDPTLGLVREFEVRGSLWGRYEVRSNETFDISAQRGQTTPGSVWDVGGRGYIYRLADPSVPYDQPPNRIVAVTFLRTEMRGIPLLPPAPAAVAIDDPTLIDIGPYGRVRGGGGPAFGYPGGGGPGAAAPDLSDLPPGAVSGTPPTVAVPSFDAGAQQVFAMRLDQLESLADVVLGDDTEAGGDEGDAWLADELWAQDPQGSEVTKTWSGSAVTYTIPGQGSVSLDMYKLFSGVRIAIASTDSGGKTTVTFSGAASGTLTFSSAESNPFSSGMSGWSLANAVEQVADSSSDTSSDSSSDTSSDSSGDSSGCSGDSDGSDGYIRPELSAVSNVTLGDEDLSRRWRWRRRWHSRGEGQDREEAGARVQHMAKDKVVFVDGDLALHPNEQLAGRVLLIVKGDLIAAPGNGTRIDGLVYVTGDAKIDGPFQLNGQIIVKGSLSLGNAPSGLAEITYDPAAIAVLKQAMARYRLSRSLRPGFGGAR